MESFEIGLEGNLGVVALLPLRLGAVLDNGIVTLGHVITKDLFELEPSFSVKTFNDEFGGEDVGKLGSIAVTTTSSLLFLVVKV